MESSVEPHRHPLLAGAAVIETALEEMAASAPIFLDASDKRALLVQLARLEARLAAVRLQTMAVADDVAAAEGARDVAALLTHDTRGDAAEHRRELALAESLDRRWTVTQTALASGALNVAQAVVITRALDELPCERVEQEVLAQAEAHLVAEAAHLGPRELRLLGRKILEVVAPDVYELEEGKALDVEERRARERTSLSLKTLGDGTTRIVIRVPDAVAGRLRTYLEAFTSPRHHRLGEADRIPAFRRLGGAFCSFLEAVDPRRLPVHGGDATTVIVTVSARGPASASSRLPGSRRVSGSTAAEARRLACTAEIIPAVLGGRSEVLDLGRRSRLFKPAQRKAMVVRDRECRRRDAPSRRAGARPITGVAPGLAVAAPTFVTAYSCVRGTTIGRTTRRTRRANAQRRRAFQATDVEGAAVGHGASRRSLVRRRARRRPRGRSRRGSASARPGWRSRRGRGTRSRCRRRGCPTSKPMPRAVARSRIRSAASGLSASTMTGCSPRRSASPPARVSRRRRAIRYGTSKSASAQPVTVSPSPNSRTYSRSSRSR